MGLFQGIKRRPALGRHVGQRRSGLGRVEEFHRIVRGRRAEKPLRLDLLLGSFPDVHQAQPAFAIAANRPLNIVVGRPSHALHRRHEVWVGVGQHPVPLLLAIEQVGERHHLTFEGGEFLPGNPHAAAVPRPLHEQPAEQAGRAQPQKTERQRAGLEDAGRLGLPLPVVGLVLDPLLRGCDQFREALIKEAVLRARHEPGCNQLRLECRAVEARGGLHRPRHVHRDLPVAYVEDDRHVTGRIEAAILRLCPPAGDHLLEELGGTVGARGGVDHHHAVVAAGRLFGRGDGGASRREVVPHAADEHPGRIVAIGGRRNRRLLGGDRRQGGTRGEDQGDGDEH